MSNKIAPNIVDVDAALATLGEMPELQYVPDSDKVRARFREPLRRRPDRAVGSHGQPARPGALLASASLLQSCACSRTRAAC